MSLLTESTQAAAQAKATDSNSLPIVFGPVPVGNIGQVAVVEREMGGKSFHYAQFTGSGRPARIPLAACAVLVEALQVEEDTPEGE